MKYRADLDGLRAMAILPVLFFHADFTFIPQGFLGVDVFFCAKWIFDRWLPTR